MTLFLLERSSLRAVKIYFYKWESKGWGAETAPSPTENGCQVVWPAAEASTHKTCTVCSVWSRSPHLVSRAELVNSKDLSWVQSLAENIYGSQLTTKHPVGVGRLGGTQETLVVALQGKIKRRILKINLQTRPGEEKNTKRKTQKRSIYPLHDCRLARAIGPQHDLLFR